MACGLASFPCLTLVVLLSPGLWAVPVITRQPQTVIDERGKISSLSVEATGDGELRYQWRYYDSISGRPGSAIAGATNEVFTPAEAPWPFLGVVVVEVTDDHGSTISESAKVDWVQRTGLVELSRWPDVFMGRAFGSAIQDNLAYVAAGSLQVFDISDRRSPVRVGAAIDHELQRGYEIDRIYERTSIQVEGNIACAMFFSTLAVYDLSDAKKPVAVARLSFGGTGVFPARLTLKDGYAYICSGWSGISIVDVREAKASKIVSQFLYRTNNALFSPLMLAIRGDTLYVAESDALVSGETSRLRIFNISNKSQPRQISERMGATYAGQTHLNLEANH